MENEVLYGVGIVTAIVAVVRQALNGWKHTARFLPLISILVAVGWHLLSQTWDVDSLGTILKNGLTTGLLASGLWSGGRALAGK